MSEWISSLNLRTWSIVDIRNGNHFYDVASHHGRSWNVEALWTSPGRSGPGSSQYSAAQARYTAGAPWMLVNLASEDQRAGPGTGIWSLRPWSMKGRGLRAHPWTPWGCIWEGSCIRAGPLSLPPWSRRMQFPAPFLHLIYLDN